MYNTELSGYMDKRLNLEQMILTIQRQMDNVEIVAAVSRARDEMGKLNELMGGADKVAELMDSVAEKKDDVDEISCMLSATGLEDVDAEEDLRMLEEEMAAEGEGGGGGGEGGGKGAKKSSVEEEEEEEGEEEGKAKGKQVEVKRTGLGPPQRVAVQS